MRNAELHQWTRSERLRDVGVADEIVDRSRDALAVVKSGLRGARAHHRSRPVQRELDLAARRSAPLAMASDVVGTPRTTLAAFAFGLEAADGERALATA